MNVGLAEAMGAGIVRADAHTTYSADYVRRCVRVLVETNAAYVRGATVPVSTMRFGRAVAAVTSSPLRLGPGKCHYARARETVDPVYLGCWSWEVLERTGGVDEGYIQSAAEDQELNLRLRKAGETIVVDPATRSWCGVRDMPCCLGRQYFNYGVCKASTLLKRLPSCRPLAPTDLVLCAVVGFVEGRGGRRGAVPLPRAVTCVLTAARLARATDTRMVDLVATVEICHWSYGFGMFPGLAGAATGRVWACRPRHGR